MKRIMVDKHAGILHNKHRQTTTQLHHIEEDKRRISQRKKKNIEKAQLNRYIQLKKNPEISSTSISRFNTGKIRYSKQY